MATLPKTFVIGQQLSVQPTPQQTERIIQLAPKLHTQIVDREEREPHFSYSQFNMYQRCGRQYEYRYVKRLKTPPTMLLGSGKAIHAAFEANSKHKMSKKIDMPVDIMLDLAATAHDKEMSDVEDADSTAKGKDKDASLSIVAHYRRTQAPAIVPLAVEFGFTVSLEDDEAGSGYLPVLGFVDSYAAVPDPRDGPTKGQAVIALEDYKKVTRRKTQLEADITPQLTLYDYVYNLQTGGLTTDIIGFRQLGFNGPRSQDPGPYSIPLYRSPSQMVPEVRQRRWRRVLEQMKATQRAVRAGIFIATDNPQICSWCGYAAICQEKAE